MISIRPISLNTLEEAATELERIGFPRSETGKLSPDTLFLHFKFEGVPDTAIQHLREIARAAGTRLMIPTTSAKGPERYDFLLSGTSSQMESFVGQVQNGSPDLGDIAAELKHTLMNNRQREFKISCPSKTLRLGRRTLVMGAINVTPDSFSDGGHLFETDSAVARALKMVEEGADIIDIGGESTRPGSRGIDADEELRRVIPVIEKVARQTDVPISVDTRKARVAREALNAGGQIVNDVGALRFDREMGEVVATHGVPVILMHMLGTPETMQKNIHYVSLISEIVDYLRQSMDLARDFGVDREKIIIDPGIGFGKTVDHNLAIIKHLYQFRILGRPILIGTSRKSFIGKILDVDVTQREEGSIASMAASILQGAHIVRVHNVRNAVRAARITDAIKGVSIPEV